MARTKRTTRTPRTSAKAGRIDPPRARALAAVGRLRELGAALRSAASTLEGAFEKRVAGAIARLGVPSAHDVHALTRQVAQLQRSVDSLRAGRARRA
jgi:hypothetical protein